MAQRLRIQTIPLALLAGLLAGAPRDAAAQGPAGAVIPPQGTRAPEMAPPVQPRVGPATPRGPAPAASQDPALARSVTITSVAIEGATAFPLARIESEIGPLTGTIPLQRVEEARVAILGLYRNAGYVFTVVDATIERGGRLRLTIGEAEIVEVRLDGDIGPAGTQVLRFLENLRGVRPIDTATLERWLLLVEDIPGVSMRAVLRPAGTAPGALSLVAQVGRQAVTGYVAADNRAFRLTGTQQGIAAVQFNAFTSLAERTELQLYYANGRTSVYGQASTEFFVGSQGARVRLYAGTGETTPSAPLRDIGYRGTTTIAGISASYPVIRRRQQSLTVSAAFDIIETEIKLEDSPLGDQVLSRDELRVLRVGGEWAVFDQLLGDERAAVNVVSLRLHQGISGLGASASGSPSLSRAGARTDFTKVSFELSRTQALFSPWAGATVSLLGVLAGQWSNDILPQAEKFYIGGSRLGRGYYAGEVTGDSALVATAEIQLSMPFETSVFGQAVRVDPMVYAFYDWGQTWENAPLDPDRRVSSAGLGTRFNLSRHAEVQLEGVRRFERRPGGDAAERLKADAFYWRVLLRY
ncbi:ShlB/FhaC/HecB family hemolysin secretion/activation protein [Roseomonas alkaliterrae]|uniref:Hemolysin activation/secretion protein n=1 Tax=Neoroseomonas alkaliterrae TaxID=1452450 RepID=A0A840Y6F4_9PROT|nr:ShlB/FhaC/HecB family hemolysin secretion/activation protein [Neoroseomonas alkaliterrae]MBB5691541.1 hemolysin activation/secretion protein [Neoroseomonas alkaliterrae]MBR0676596.1 ShlB/FhaC/HecB family hemolysin secretion/activation protein [Neoroseomonas alkaliterrae]